MEHALFVETLINMRRNGETTVEIARVTGESQKKVWRWCDKLDLRDHGKRGRHARRKSRRWKAVPGWMKLSAIKMRDYGLSQYTIARLLGLTQPHVSKIVRGV